MAISGCQKLADCVRLSTVSNTCSLYWFYNGYKNLHTG